MQIHATAQFRKSYKRLRPSDQEAVDKALRLLVENPSHPSLSVGKLQPKAKGRWYCRATIGIRIVFQRSGEDVYLLEVSPHKIL